MKVRIILLILAAGVAGLFWSLGSPVHAVVAHFIAPPLFAVAVASSFRTASWRRQSLLLAVALTVAELVRLIAYSIVSDGWHYVSADGETQLAMLVSFALQCVVAFLVWAVTGFLIRRFKGRVA